MFAGNFAPRGWGLCDGQLLAISQNDALFSLLGTIYGGDGRTTFGLPDLRGRLPIHWGSGPGLGNYKIGQKGGQENVALTANQIPSHTHTLTATSSPGNENAPDGNLLAAGPNVKMYLEPDPPNPPANAMNAEALLNSGGSQAHTNLMPSLCINFIIALFGVYPSRH